MKEKEWTNQWKIKRVNEWMNNEKKERLEGRKKERERRYYLIKIQCNIIQYRWKVLGQCISSKQGWYLKSLIFSLVVYGYRIKNL